MRTPSDRADEEFIRGLQEGYLWLRRPDIVSIAAVQGHAIGGGFQLALACDLRVVADDVKFAMKEPALGIVPDLTGTKPLVDIVGVPRALELCLTARTVFAEEAARLGLAELVVPAAELDYAVDDLVAAILAIRPDDRRGDQAAAARRAGQHAGGAGRGRTPRAGRPPARDARLHRLSPGGPRGATRVPAGWIGRKSSPR